MEQSGASNGMSPDHMRGAEPLMLETRRESIGSLDSDIAVATAPVMT